MRGRNLDFGRVAFRFVLAVAVLGFDPVRQPLEVKRRVGYLPDAVGFYDNLTARENLTYTARLLDIPRREIDARIVEALASVDLADVVDKWVRALEKDWSISTHSSTKLTKNFHLRKR